MTERGIIARMLDAALPYAAGRRLRTHGLDEGDAAALAKWADPEGEKSCTLVAGNALPGPDVEPGGLLLWLIPGTDEPGSLEGYDIIETQFAFRIPYGLADDTAAPTLPPDDQWACARETGGVWLDSARPDEILGRLVIAERAKGAV